MGGVWGSVDRRPCIQQTLLYCCPGASLPFTFVRVDAFGVREKRENRQQVASRILWGKHTIDIQLIRLALHLKFTLQKINKI